MLSRSLTAYRRLLVNMQEQGIADSAYVDRMLSSLFGDPKPAAADVESPPAPKRAALETPPTQSTPKIEAVPVTPKGKKSRKRAKVR